MTRTVVIGLVGGCLMALVWFLTHHFWMSDAAACRRLIGTWEVSPYSQNPYVRSTVKYGPDGTWVQELTCSTNNFVLNQQGTWKVKNGVFTETITNSTSTNLPVPVVATHMRIVRLDDREFVTKSGDDPRMIDPTLYFAHRVAQ